MTAGRSIQDIISSVESELAGTRYACSSLSPLSGGTGNFVLRGVLSVALDDRTREVLVKHGEDYVAHNPNFPLPTSRCHAEKDCLLHLSAFPACSNSTCVVRTPRLYQFDETTNTQIQEYLADSLDLKSYALKYYAPTDPSAKPQCLGIGQGLGAWLRGFHEWAQLPEQMGLRDKVRLNDEMRSLKYTINYANLIQTVDRFPILEDARPTFEEVAQMAMDEMKQGGNSQQVIHGDFWTGNILLPDAPPPVQRETPVFVIDWELCQLGARGLDLGQMIAELYELTLFKGIQAGLWLIEGFSTGYAPDDELAFRSVIHVGTHLICWGSRVPGWGNNDQIEEVVATGKELILRAWKKDRAYFERGHLAALFPTQHV